MLTKFSHTTTSLQGFASWQKITYLNNKKILYFKTHKSSILAIYVKLTTFKLNKIENIINNRLRLQGNFVSEKKIKITILMVAFKEFEI